MSLIPSVKATSGSTLHRSYFTSELFVTAAREDIATLLSTFDHLVEDEPEPFTIFKQVWLKEGWEYVHLYILEPSARDEYLKTMFRLFVERMTEEEDEVLQIGALFGLYTFYTMQMVLEESQRVEHIPICIDTLEHIVSLGQSCEEVYRPRVLLILERFLSGDVFHILPVSRLSPQNPTRLPHSRLVRKDDEAVLAKQSGKSQAARDRAGRARWQLLSTWVDTRATEGLGGSIPLAGEYDTAKAQALRSVSEDIERDAERNALARLKGLSTTAETGSSTEGIERFEKMLDKGAGILRNQWKAVDF